MLDGYEINNLEQLRAMSDILRVRIVDHLREEPMTVTQLAGILKLAPAKVHYHVRELERVGLLRLVETREKGGILEKYYQPIARNISVAPGLLLTTSQDEVSSTIGSLFDQIRAGFLDTLREAVEQKNVQPLTVFNFGRFYLTEEEHQHLYKQIGELTKPYERRRSIEGEQEIFNVIIAYPQLAEQSKAIPGATEVAEIAASTAPRYAFLIGMTSYSRKDLEEIVTQGERLRISFIGVCHIADDVSPELADRAIEKFSYVGKVYAPEAVREILEKKRSK